jgi:protein-tyrosine phosphatase
MKILMVCLGNICRSPLAEGILKHKVSQHDLAWEVDSAGTGAWHIGELPDRRSIAKAREYGINITDQRARQLKPEDLSYFDLILTMDESNYRNALQLASSEKEEAKVKMIMDYVSPGQRIDVPDPYWDDDGFEQVYQMLDRACGVIIEKYK